MGLMSVTSVALKLGRCSCAARTVWKMRTSGAEAFTLAALPLPMTPKTLGVMPSSVTDPVMFCSAPGCRGGDGGGFLPGGVGGGGDAGAGGVGGGGAVVPA